MCIDHNNEEMQPSLHMIPCFALYISEVSVIVSVEARERLQVHKIPLIAHHGFYQIRYSCLHDLWRGLPQALFV